MRCNSWKRMLLAVTAFARVHNLNYSNFFRIRRANIKLDMMLRGHAIELTKLKAQLKKEEISRQSVTEQLVQKTKENEELVKICDELINGQGS